MKSNQIIQIILVAFALTFLTFLLSLISDRDFSTTYYLWDLLANLLISAVIGYYVVHSFYYSIKLWLATFAIFYVIGNFNIVIEALIFNVIDRDQSINILLMGIPYAMAGSFIMTWIFGRWNDQENTIPTSNP